MEYPRANVWSATGGALLTANEENTTHDGRAAPSLRRPVFLGSELFGRRAFPGNHPLRIIRHSAVRDLATILGWLDGATYREITPAGRDQLLEFHVPAYVDALQYADTEGIVSTEARETFNIGTLENPLFPGLYDRAAATVGGSIEAARLALDGHVAFHPSGGTHHGRPDRAVGFCYFNDPVFAIRTLEAGGCRQVAYVDLDAHHGDGVEAAFADDPSVLTLSIHEAGRWPNSGMESDAERGVFNFPVPRGFSDPELEYLLEEAILPLVADADGLVLCCGADSLDGDPLSAMTLSNVALWRAVERLLDLGVPTVVLGGGGYNPWTLTRYWAGLWGVISEQAMPDSLPEAAVELFSAMDCDLVDEEDRDPRWFATMADTPYTGVIRPEIELLVESARA